MENIGFAGINYQWFIGQVPPNQTLDKTDPDGWGDRVKVRIVGMHNKAGAITPDEQLPWAIVERPTSQGNASRGSTGLTGGEWVRGYFLDPFNQVPVITSVLGRGTYENNVSLQIVKERKSTEFENITRFNSFAPYSGQMRGGNKPVTPAQPTKQEFEQAKDSMTFDASKLSTSTEIARDYTAKDKAEDQLLLRSIQRGELGPVPREQIDAIINRINGVGGQVRGV
jgi:hypothetical protein